MCVSGGEDIVETVIWASIGQAITDATGTAGFIVDHKTELCGGSINQAYRIDGGGQRYFVKLNRAKQLSMFEAEQAGLEALAASKTIRVPYPLCVGSQGNQAWLVTEYIEFSPAGPASAEHLGQQLAALHRSGCECFGWHRDNTIGATPQYNARMPDWIEFYREQRLRVQFTLAANNGFTGALQSKGERLMQDLDIFFADYQPTASLLHGDLWGGNCAFDAFEAPVIFDPAVYYGDREADMAMTELFGGFGSEFYDAYNDVWPLHDGYSVRKILYNLYHILNHANLFGGGYVAQAESMLDRLLAEI